MIRLIRIHLCLVLLLGPFAGRGVAAPLTAALRSRLQGAPRVGGSVIDALEREDRVRVMIALADPDPHGSAAGEADRRARRRAIGAARRALLQTLAAGDLAVEREFGSIPAIAGEITANGLLRLLDNPVVARIDIDRGGSGHLLEAVPLMRLDTVQNLGFTGQGVTVAVLDSGADTDHPDLRDGIVDQHCFCSGGVDNGCCPDGSTEQSGPGSAEDDNGHGTNVAGIITSDGTVAPPGGAPDAQIVAVKVLDRFNSFCCGSDIVAALDWIINNRPDVGVVNMSLGTFALHGGECDGDDATTMAFAQAIDMLHANGVAVFASSGNQGSGTQMAAPACIAHTIAVGAVWDSDVGAQSLFNCSDITTTADKVTCFSNANASTDVFAPGGPMTSTGIGGGTSTYRGTSQASPAAAACAAALLQLNPDLSPDDIEAALESSSTLVTDVSNTLSFPRVDCEQALAVVAQFSPTPSPTATPSVTLTPTASPSPTASATRTNRSRTPTRTATPTRTRRRTVSPTPTASAAATPTPSTTHTASPTEAPTQTPTETPTTTGSATATETPSVIPQLSATATLTHTVVPTSTSISPAPTVTPTAAHWCAGDCNGNGTVIINELVIGVNIVLEQMSVSRCRAIDEDANDTVTISELTTAVNSVLLGCPEVDS